MEEEMVDYTKDPSLNISICTSPPHQLQGMEMELTSRGQNIRIFTSLPNLLEGALVPSTFQLIPLDFPQSHSLYEDESLFENNPLGWLTPQEQLIFSDDLSIEALKFAETCINPRIPYHSMDL